MSEIWVAGAVTLVGGVVSGMGQEKKDKANQAHDKAMTKESAKWNAALSQFDAEQADYYNQLNRQRKQRGLDNFRSFSTVGNFAPNYTQTSTGVELPKKPNYEDTFGAEEQGSGGSKGGGMSRLLDPLKLF